MNIRSQQSATRWILGATLLLTAVTLAVSTLSEGFEVLDWFVLALEVFTLIFGARFLQTSEELVQSIQKRLPQELIHLIF